MKPSPAEKRCVLMLAGAQALFQTTSVMVMTLSGLVGLQLATDKSLATLPIAMMMVGAALLTIPASLLMQRFGRKAGFLLGIGLGGLGGLLAALAIGLGSFWLFVGANMLVGCYQGFAQYYRFAAADVASLRFKSRAISWVVAGGVVAALAGPNIARLTQDLGPLPYLYSYLAIMLLSLFGFILVMRLQLPAVAVEYDARGPARPLWQIARQPVFFTALTCSAVGYAVMIMVMTATPLAMRMCGLPPGDSATVIQWHVLGMFVPSFFTGNLILRFGELRVMGAGVLLLGAHVAVALSGEAFLHFLSGLILLGIGWNFLFIGGTTLLTKCYRPSERARTQAMHDFLVFGVISVASFSAGSLLHRFGWQTVNLAAVPFLALVLVLLLGLALHRKQGQPMAAD